MLLPFTVAATVLSLLSALPPLLHAPSARRIAARIVAGIISFTVLCTLDCCSFRKLLTVAGRACLTISKTVCYKLRFDYCLLLGPMGPRQSFKLWRYRKSHG